MGRLVPRRRPSAALIIALLALFVALGGPAGAANLLNGKLLKKGTVTGRAIKDRSLTTRDISRRSVRALQRPPKGSITAAQLANGSVTTGKLARGAVGSAAIARGGVMGGNLATGSVGSPQVANGSLTTADLARWSGRFSVDIPPIPAGQCWSREPVIAALDSGHADIRGDVVEVTPDASWPRVRSGSSEYALSLTVYTSAAPSRFVISICNPANGGNLPPNGGSLPAVTTRVGFSYAVFNVP